MKRIDLCQFHVGSHSDAGGYPKTKTAEEKHQLDQEEADGVEPILPADGLGDVKV